MSNLYAYDAGFEDGKKWQERDKVPDEGWHQMTIQAMGIAAFGVRCGIEDKAVVARGEAWDAACSEYNRGFGDGISSRA